MSDDAFAISSLKEMKECDKVMAIPDVPVKPTVSPVWSIREIVDALLSPSEDYLATCLPDGVAIKSSIALKLRAHPDFEKHGMLEARVDKTDGTTYWMLWHKVVWDRQYRNKLSKDIKYRIIEAQSAQVNKRYNSILNKVGKHFRNLTNKARLVDTVNLWIDCYKDEPENHDTFEYKYLKKFGYFDVDPEDVKEIEELEQKFRQERDRYNDLVSATNPYFNEHDAALIKAELEKFKDR